MSDVRKHVERLMELREERWKDPKYSELAASSELIARAYLAECEAHERTREAAKLLAQEILKAHKARGHALTAAAGDVDAVIMARDLLASIEKKEGVSK